MMMGPSSSSATMTLSSSSPSATSSRPFFQSRRGPIDARQSSGNNASSSGIGGGFGSSSRATSSRSSSSSSSCNGLRMRIRAAAGVRLAGSGSSAPAHVLTNADLSQLVETNDEWIAQRTGIRCVAFLFSSFFRRRRRRSSFIGHQPIERSRSKQNWKEKNRDALLESLSCTSSRRIFPQVADSMLEVAIVAVKRGERKRGVFERARESERARTKKKKLGLISRASRRESFFPFFSFFTSSSSSRLSLAVALSLAAPCLVVLFASS